MRMDLTIQQLRVVVAVHDAGSFTAAAETLLLAQSSLSRSVLEVERRLGVPLFDRTTRSLEPTAEGREFVAIARSTVASFDANLRHFAGFLDGQRGLVRVAALPSLAAILLPAIVSAYQSRHPEVGLSIEDALAGEVLERVRTGVVDFAVTVVSATANAVDDLYVTPVAVDRFCCVFPPGHRFATCTEVAWSDLATGRSPSPAHAHATPSRHATSALWPASSRPDSVCPRCLGWCFRWSGSRAWSTALSATPGWNAGSPSWASRTGRCRRRPPRSGRPSPTRAAPASPCHRKRPGCAECRLSRSVPKRSRSSPR
jgi:DNA-binding transcriptional LysR family regulator